MRITYHQYYFLDEQQNKIKYDIRPFLESFINNAPTTFKQKFNAFGDHLYLFKTTQPYLYFFMRTRDDEIVQKINNNTLDIEDIRDHLNTNEKLGFSSYVYFDDDFIGFSSTHLAPSITLLGEFINALLKEISSKLSFVLKAVVTSLSKSKAKKLALVSRAFVKIPAETPFTADLLETLGKKGKEHFVNLDYVEISFKAMKDKSLPSSIVNTLIDDASDYAQRMILRAKTDLADSLRDYYIAESGGLADNIYKGKKAHETERKIVEKIESNLELQGILNGKRKYETIKNDISDPIHVYISPDSWTD